MTMDDEWWSTCIYVRGPGDFKDFLTYLKLLHLCRVVCKWSMGTRPSNQTRDGPIHRQPKNVNATCLGQAGQNVNATCSLQLKVGLSNYFHVHFRPWECRAPCPSPFLLFAFLHCFFHYSPIEKISHVRYLSITLLLTVLGWPFLAIFTALPILDSSA